MAPADGKPRMTNTSMLNSIPVEPSTAMSELDVTPTALMANTP
ncbi:Uncharacterised protein [Mycobacterium tuberculosis]|nr:Uncharacterised protein [Mycobacterium tuberculosis]